MDKKERKKERKNDRLKLRLLLKYILPRMNPFIYCYQWTLSVKYDYVQVRNEY